MTKKILINLVDTLLSLLGLGNHPKKTDSVDGQDVFQHLVFPIGHDFFSYLQPLLFSSKKR